MGLSRAQGRSTVCIYGKSLQYACLALVVCVIYANTLCSPFVLDDKHSIQNNVHIRLETFTIAGLKEVIFESPAPNRPVANISFALNYYFHRYNVIGYHIVNILTHIATSLLLYLFVQTTLRLPWLHVHDEVYTGMAFFTALLWVVHPLQTESVTYVVQRMNSLAALFYLLSLVLYAQARLAEDQRKKWVLFAGCILAGLLAVASKEIAATLPCFIMLYEWYFFQDLRLSWVKRHNFLAASIVVFLVVLALVYLGIHPLDELLRTYKNPDFTHDFTLPERVLTEWRVVIFYLWLLLWPHPSQLNLDHDFPLSHSLLHPASTLLALGAIVGILGLAVARARQDRVLSFCLVWFVGNLAIESSVVGLELIFEHRVYLPSMLLSWLAVRLVYRALQPAWLRVGVLAAVAVVWAIWTYDRNGVWVDEVTLWQDCIAKAPHKARPHNNLGAVLERQGNVAEAARHYSEALRLSPAFAEAHSNLGAVLERQGNVTEAVRHYSEALRINPAFAGAHNNLGVVLERQGNVTEAVRHYNEALRLNPAYATVHNNLGVVLERQGNMAEAVRHYSEALRLNPAFAEAHNNLGVALERQGNAAGAVRHYSEAVRLNPAYAEAYYRLGTVLIQQGKHAEAITAYRAALHHQPGWSQAANNLAYLLATQANPSLHDVTEAIQLAEEACYATGYENASMLGTLAVAYAAAGRRPDALQTAHHALAQARAAGEATVASWLQAWLARYELDHMDYGVP